MEKSEFVVAIGILLLIFFAWVAVGGPGRVSSTSLFVSSPFPSFSSDAFSGGEIRERDGPIEIGQPEESLDVIRRELQRIALLGDPSPFRGKVIIRKSSFGPDRALPREEYIELEVKENHRERILITGWRLESSVTGKSATIGEASSLPAANNISAVHPFFVEPGDKIVISTGRSPIGVSFRTNLCTGYLEQFQDFFPSLERKCPLPEDELVFAENSINDFDEACLGVVESLPRCTFYLGELPFSSNDSCRSFIANELSYRGCIDNHRGEGGFLRDEWRVFLGRTTELWRESREAIRLRDAEGKIVDVFSY